MSTPLNTIAALLLGVAAAASASALPPAPAAVAADTLAAPGYFDMMGRADTAIADGNWDEAEQWLLQALSADPDNPANVMILSNLGIVQYNLGRDSLALHSLDEAHRRAPRSVTVLANRADVLLAMGRDSLALADFAAVARLDSTAVDARYMLAMLSLRAGDTLAARAYSRELTTLAPDSLPTAVANASLLCATEHWAEAIPHYSRILDRAPSAGFYAARAVCYLMTDRLAEASADISSGLALDPDDPELYLYRAYLNKMRYLHDDALADLRRALAASRLRRPGAE